MKKHISVFIIICALAAVLMGTAYADASINLGDFSAGSTVSMSTNIDYTGNITYDESLLPTGCTISVLNGKIFLTGVPTVAGQYDFVISDGENNYTCTATVTPAIPTAVSDGNRTVAVNDSLVIGISASTPDNGALSFQWYSNTTASTVGGTAIAGAVSNVYTVNTAHSGVTYYYCVVTNTNNGQTVTNVSDVITVTVAAPTVTGISISTMPTKTAYKVGDSVDTMGLVLLVTYSDGSTSAVSTGYTVSPTKLTEAGTPSIKVTYEGHDCYFPVVVESEKLSVIVYSMPAKTTYKLGDQLDTSGLVLRVTDANNNVKDVTTGFTCAPMVLNSEGKTTILVTYENNTCNFTVNVTKDSLDTVSVASLPLKTEYVVGDSLDTAGLKLRVASNGKFEDVDSGFTCTPTSFTSAGRQTVTVKYNNLSCTFAVNVKDAASTAPAVPTPEVSPVPTPPTNDRNSSIKVDVHHTLVVIIVVLAVLALAALGLYVYVARVKDYDQSPIAKFFDKFKK